MKISLQGIAEQRQWEEKGYSLPKYDMQKVARAAKENPFWIHFGAGKFVSCISCCLVQNLLDAGKFGQGNSCGRRI